LKKIRFLHIPKTAGTTFTQLLNGIYHDKKSFHFSGDFKSDAHRFNLLSEQEKDNIELIVGHAPINTGIEYIDDIETITFLREPVSRVKSFCQHVYEGKSEYLLSRFPKEKFDLDAFLNSRVLELHNLQVKMLLNTGACAPTIQVPRCDAVNMAFNNLTQKVSAYGLLEYFDESLILFKKQFNWYLPHYKITNTKNEKELLKFEPRHIEKIMDNNELDLKLYQLAKDRFEEKIHDKSFSIKTLKRYRRKLFDLQTNSDKLIDLFEKVIHRTKS